MPSKEGEHQLVVESVIANVVEVDQSLVLISQPPRSGGALLARLLDDHPACHVAPLPLEINLIQDLVRLAEGRAGWNDLNVERLELLFPRGYWQPKPKLHGDRTTYPLLIPPDVLRSLFAWLIARPDADKRRLLDCYATSFFNAWLDNRNLRADEGKRWVVVRAPRALQGESAAKVFRELYPNGRMICVLRDPWTWYASARRWGSRWSEIRLAMKTWTRDVREMERWRLELGDAIKLVAFEDLLLHTKKTMRSVTRFLSISRPRLPTMPTINGLPVRPASSFPTEGTAISMDPLHRHSEMTADEIESIERHAGQLYRSVRELAGHVPSQAAQDVGPRRASSRRQAA